MPSTYAHVRFGNDVLRCLPQKQQQQIEAYRELFDIGLHGPDLLFYYRPLTSDPVNRIGYAMHEQPASSFFIHAGDVWHKSGFQDEYAAYIYGFLCHFALDRECHDYIDEKIAESGDTLYISTFSAGREDGLQVRFDRGSGARSQEYHMKNDRLDGAFRRYDPDTGELIYEATYQYGRLHGKERTLVRDNRYDYWEACTYVNGRKTGPFESHYVKNNQLREAGEYRNGHRIGRWKLYDINGKLEKEWEETK